LSIAMGMLVSLAVGMRVKWRRVRVESTRAMLKSVGMRVGQLGARFWGKGVVVGMYVPMPSCRAFSSAAAEAILAASRERQGRGLVAIVGFAGEMVGSERVCTVVERMDFVLTLVCNEIGTTSVSRQYFHS